MRLAVDVPGVVLGRPAELEQRLLEVAALGGVHDHGGVVEAGAEHRLDLLGPQHLLQDRPVGAGEHQPVGRVLLEAEPAVAGHRLGDVDQQRVRYGVAAEREQGVDHLLGVVAGGACVPEAERGQPVGVHVLRGALELGEGCDRLAAVLGTLVVDLEQEGLVGLDDQGAVVHAGSPRRWQRSEQRRGVLTRRLPPQPSGGPDRPRRWHARNSGPSSSGATGWGRCRRRRGHSRRRRTRPASWRPGRRRGWRAPSSDSATRSSATEDCWSATCMCQSGPAPSLPA